MEENHYHLHCFPLTYCLPLTYCFRSLQGQFCCTQMISFLKLFREMNSFIFSGAISQFLGDLIAGAFRTMIHCVQRRYPKISIFSEIVPLCCLCNNISYNFIRLLFYLKHLYSKALDVSMMSRY